MKVSGFTFVRNAIKYDYPIIEAIRSILPICDEVVVAVGNSEDDTLQLIKSIDSSKIKIIETVWDDSLREGGRVLAVETDKAFAAVAEDSDWAFYIQGDEVMHEKYLDTVRNAMLLHKDNPKVDGLLFKYKHFYGSYDYVGESLGWYRREIRVVRNRKDIYSYRDAQGFRKGKNQKLNVALIDAHIYHYGWVKEPKAMQGKLESFNKLWHSDDWVEKNIAKADAFDYTGIDALSLFKESHPAVMSERVAVRNWKFSHDLSRNRFKFKDKFKRAIESVTGHRIGEYRNYKIV
ncbi:glycosyltransferase family 2 protein [uncultured Pontibacter sp.]|uniref:glycosyltransferase family 2 protein n=1 Tax=uncultured Pontibacter sp. TaxID=453356 RepID=UPI0026096F8E|nr:glycosyltransferase family 2 protein [uncultured Pontibacter sp.]